MRLTEIEQSIKSKLKTLSGPRGAPEPADRAKEWDDVKGVNWRPHSKNSAKQRTSVKNFTNWDEFVEQLFANVEQNLPSSMPYTVYLNDRIPYIKVRSKNNWGVGCGVKGKNVFFAVDIRNMFPRDDPTHRYGENTPVALLAKFIKTKFGDARLNKNEISIEPKTKNNDIDLLTSEFIEFIEIIGSSKIACPKGISGARGVSTKSRVKRSNSDIRYYLGAASLIFVATRFGMGSLLPRGGGENGTATFDIRDSIIAIGATEGAMEIYRDTGRWDYREHAVPCKVIVDAGIEMVQRNRPKNGELMADGDKQLILDVASMIRNNLTLVYCTKQEADLIDTKYESTMPPGFDPITGGDVLARFQEFGIKVYNFEGQPLGE
jgi:hypothetical protein